MLHQLRSSCLSLFSTVLTTEQGLGLAVHLLMTTKSPTLTLLLLRTQHRLLQVDFHLLETLSQVPHRQYLLFQLQMLQKSRKTTQLPVLGVAIKRLNTVEVIGVQQSGNGVILDRKCSTSTITVWLRSRPSIFRFLR